LGMRHIEHITMRRAGDGQAETRERADPTTLTPIISKHIGQIDSRRCYFQSPSHSSVRRGGPSVAGCGDLLAVAKNADIGKLSSCDEPPHRQYSHSYSSAVPRCNVEVVSPMGRAPAAALTNVVMADQIFSRRGSERRIGIGNASVPHVEHKQGDNSRWTR
jgi:hypothetical protein